MNFKNFLEKAKKTVPKIAEFGLNLGTGNYLGALKNVGDALAKAGATDEKAKELSNEFELRKQGFQYELEKLYFEDKKDSRKMYILDSILQKIYAISFLAGYFIFSFFVLILYVWASYNKIVLESFVVGLIGTIIGFIGAKVSTIIDFLFGSSQPTENVE